MLTKRLIIALMALCCINAYGYISHKVQRNQTLWGISRMYNVSPDDIIKANPQAETGLAAGMMLRIPEEADLKELRSQATVPDANNNAIDSADYKPQSTANVDKPQAVDNDDQAGVPAKASASTESAKAGNDKPIDEDNPAFYRARVGDTFASIGSKTGVNVSTLRTLNPTIGDEDITAGTIVRISNEKAPFPSDGNISMLDSIIYKVMPTVVLSDSPSNKELNIAIMLPFANDLEEIPRASLLATDFYKGFLMALEKNRNNINYPVKVITVDTHGSIDELESQLRELADEGINVIIPPDDEEKSEIIRRFAAANNATVLNVLSVRDNSYMTDPNVLQCNISQGQMYDKVITMLLNNYRGYTPVILNHTNGKAEKASFVDQLKTAYANNGVKPIEIAYSRELTAEDLSRLSPEGRYIFIPVSGSTDTFDSFADVLNETIGYELYDDRLKVFGYPDWIAFRGEQADKLHQMGAIIYSRYYTDSGSYEVEGVDRDFVNWYGCAPEDVFPNQGYLGFDTGNYILQGIGTRTADELRQPGQRPIRGLQSTFDFIQQPDSAGMINNALYIIEFQPGQIYSAKVI